MTNYQFLDEIGRGSDGVIYRAKDIINDRDVAIKKVFDGQSEVDNYLKMNHLLYIPELLDHFIDDDDDYTYLVIELIEGSSIHQLIDINQDCDWYWEMQYRILLLIQDLHNAGFYHGDLHRNNLMLSNDNKLYLIDLSQSGQLSSMRSDDERLMNPIILPEDWYETREYEELSPEEMIIDNLRHDYMTSGILGPDYKNENHGLKRYQLLCEFCQRTPREDIDKNGRYITDREYINRVIEEYHRIDQLIFS